MTPDERTGADLFVETLQQYGVSRVFGNPGTTELPVMQALGAPDTELEYVLGLHEDVAVGAAAGYAQARRYHSHDDPSVLPAGVANLHITPGLAHGLGNLYGAAWAGAPLVVTAGNHELDFRHEEPLLTGDLEAMAEQFCEFSAEVTHVDALPGLLRRAFRAALTPPTGPVFLALPFDVMLEPTDADPEPLGPIPTAGRGDPAGLAAAAELLAGAADPVLVFGDEVARAGAVEEAVALAEAVGGRAFAEILACEVNFPADHDQFITYLPPDEGLASMLMSGDVVCFVGCSTNTTLLRHEEPLVDSDTACVHIGPGAPDLAKHQPADAAVLADPGAAMAELADRVEERLDPSALADRLEQTTAVRESLAGTVRSMGEDPTPEGETRPSKADLVDALMAVVPDAQVIDEGITAKYPLLTRWPFGEGALISNKGGGLGYGLPASVGAAFAARERRAEGGDPRPVVGYVGDGSYLYYPSAVYTAVRHGLDLTVVVPDNRNYRILKDNTQSVFGGTDADHAYVGMDIDPPVDIPANAESYGATGHRVETPGALEGTLSTAIEAEGTHVVDVLVHD
jgi:benzoylformate decarboxylase